MATQFTSTFAGGNESPLSEGGTWATAGTTFVACQIVSNKARGTAVSAQNKSLVVAEASSDQRVTATFSSDNTGDGYIHILTRASKTADTCYLAAVNAANLGGATLSKFVAGAFSDIATGLGSYGSSDTIACEAIGTTIKQLKNGAQIGSQTDTAIASGYFGIGTYCTTNVANAEIDNVVGESLGPYFVAAGTKGAAATGNITLGAPASPQTGDIWIAAVHSSDQVAHTFTDWTQIVQANGGSTNSRLSVWYFRYAGSIPNLIVTHAAGQSPVGGIAAFRNCKTTASPVNVSSSVANGTDASIEHTAVTSSADYCLLLVINGAGDDNTRTALTGYTVALQESTNNAFLNALGNPDGSVAMWFKAANLVSGVSSGTVTVTQAAADSWASTLIALEVSAGAATPITKDIPADALGSYADEMTVERRGPLRWSDSITFDLQSVGTTPKEANLPADSIGPHADQAPLLRFAFLAAPAADSMAMADAPTLRLAFSATPAADSMAIVDQAPTIRLALNVAFSDSLGLYSDQTPTIDRRGILTAAPAADSLAYVDSTSGFFTIAARPSDDLNQWTDQRTVFLTGEAALTAEPLPDSLNNWVDSSSSLFSLRAQPSADALPTPVDELSVITGKRISLAADAMASSDQLTGAFNYFAQQSDALPNYTDQLATSTLAAKSATFSDALPSYTDQVSAAGAKSAGFSDALGSYTDALTAAAAKNASRTDTLANWGDQVGFTKNIVGVPRVGWVDSVVATTLPTRIGWQDSVTVVRSLGTDRIVQLTSIKPIPVDTPNLQVGFNHGFVTYLVDGSGNYIVDEFGNRIITSGLIDNLAQSDSIAITRTEAELTPKFATLTDAIPAKVDSIQAIRGIIPIDVPLSDALPVYADAPQITQVGLLTPSFSDNLAGYADFRALSTTGEKRISQSDAIPAYTESVQIGYTAFLTAAASDSLENYVDDATVNTSGSIAVPLSDAIDAPNDFLQTHRTGNLTVSLTDAIGVPIDAVAITRAGVLRITASDNLAAYADSPRHGRGLFYSVPADGLANYLDVATQGGTGLIQAALSDNLGQYADSRATFADFNALPPADDLAAYGDSPTGLLGLNIIRSDGLFLGVRSPDELDARVGSIDELLCELSDDLNQWADATVFNRSYFAIRLGGNVTAQVSLTGKVVEEQIGINGKAVEKADLAGELYIGDP